jgi:hypothetical protein
VRNSRRDPRELWFSSVTTTSTENSGCDEADRTVPQRRDCHSTSERGDPVQGRLQLPNILGRARATSRALHGVRPWRARAWGEGGSDQWIPQVSGTTGTTLPAAESVEVVWWGPGVGAPPTQGRRDGEDGPHRVEIRLGQPRRKTAQPYFLPFLQISVFQF